MFYCQDTLGSQQLSLTSEVRAIDDTIYYLASRFSLRHVEPRIELRQFLSETRQLARKLFFTKALSLRVLQVQKDEGNKK